MVYQIEMVLWMMKIGYISSDIISTMHCKVYICIHVRVIYIIKQIDRFYFICVIWIAKKYLCHNFTCPGLHKIFYFISLKLHMYAKISINSRKNSSIKEWQ